MNIVQFVPVKLKIRSIKNKKRIDKKRGLKIEINNNRRYFCSEIL